MPSLFGGRVNFKWPGSNTASGSSGEGVRGRSGEVRRSPKVPKDRTPSPPGMRDGLQALAAIDWRLSRRIEKRLKNTEGGPLADGVSLPLLQIFQVLKTSRDDLDDLINAAARQRGQQQSAAKGLQVGLQVATSSTKPRRSADYNDFTMSDEFFRVSTSSSGHSSVKGNAGTSRTNPRASQASVLSSGSQAALDAGLLYIHHKNPGLHELIRARQACQKLSGVKGLLILIAKLNEQLAHATQLHRHYLEEAKK